MRLLTEDASLTCDHLLGKVSVEPSQPWVTVEGRKLLVEDDPEHRSISRCPNIGISIKPCTHTLAVERGYSTFLRIDGHRICLDSVRGLTDGTPPGTVHYQVRAPGQDWVSGDE
jgi:hypothetical protein